MATDPVPEPLTNQEVTEENRTRFENAATAASARNVAEMPPALPPAEQNRRLNEAAAKIGRTAGRTTASVRELPRRASDVAEHTTAAGSSKMDELRDRVSQAADQAQQSVSEAYDRAKTQAARTYNQARRQTADTYVAARSRARHLMHEYPFHVIATAAAVGLVAGVLLRIWRSSRYE
jgi:ElaB/YqjD/DUF883 family membrane-anchored ribosome-binding protein